ncbi:hypothetical protein GCE9029_03166 [Grimontia celer]|uniref:Uncharacterized protein n=1 Tax=Grimontia celer TaxID=1796497 RepID=A0A128F6A1_9GAMM|nr:hypothetical protein [Grimontia celer]CZF82337.1 hypothetical protein GCE9029_03166 [Grimontia celer]
MNTIIKSLTLFTLPVFLIACGGGGGGDTSGGSGGSGSTDISSSSPTTSLVNTEDIVAPRAFKFCIGDAIQLSVNYSGSTSGALHVYSHADYVHTNGDVDVDPLSRLTTIYPDLTTSVDIEINGNWEQIYARWVPMSSSEPEQTFVVTLNQASGAYVISF